MNDEIKEMNLSEMLFNRDERLLDYITNLQQERDTYYSIVSQKLTKEIDYQRLNELQQENERLKVDEHFFTECGFTNVEQLALCYVDYKSRCEKAIEYIKAKGLKEEEWQNGFCISATATYTRDEIFDLLNILQNGSDENGND